MTIPELIRGVQGALKLAIDGVAGPQTWAAIYRTIVKQSPPAMDPRLDPRSQTTIATLHPHAQHLAAVLIRDAFAEGIQIRIISGTRTYAEQDALYEQGRAKPGKIVTNARGGHSNHNFGLAFDIGIFAGSAYKPESPYYRVVGILGKSLGLEWGGDWQSIHDEPHFQLRPPWATGMTESEMLAGLRERRAAGHDLFT